MNNLVNSNLPTSFDVTPLLTKLNKIESDGQTGNLIHRVKLIELDPYQYKPADRQPAQRNHTQLLKSHDETRLFLAVAYGNRVVVAQLIALELGRVNDDENENDDDNNNTDVVGLDEGGELEWLDVSDVKILSRDSVDEIGIVDPAVIYPPLYAESLPSYTTQESDGVNVENCDYGTTFAADITSCALIPSPAIRTSNSMSGMLTERTVSVMIGTANDQVLSILLHVSVKVESTTTSSTHMTNVCFALEYDECKTIKDGQLKEDPQVTRTNAAVDAKYPCVQQLLPHSKRFGPVENNDNEEDSGGDDTSNFDAKDSSNNEKVQVYHPALQAMPSNNHHEDINVTCSGVKSISFRRDNSRSTGLGDTTQNNDVIMNQDIIWITYGNGTIVKLPSWKPFVTFQTRDSADSDLLDSIDNALESTNSLLGDGSFVVPLGSTFRSPLDVPPRHMTHRHNPDNKTEKTSTDEYWNTLSLAVSSQKNASRKQRKTTEPAVKALVIAGQSAPVSTPPIAFNSSQIKIDPLLAVTTTQEGTKHDATLQSGGQGLHGTDGDQNLDTSSEDEQYGPVTGTVVEGTAAIMKGALGVALGAVRWGLGSGTRGANDQLGDDDTDEFMDVDDTLNEETTNHREDFHSKSDHPFVKKGGDVHDLFPWPLSGASFPFSDLPRRFETATVDPTQSLLATTDNLGRVMLFDLETNQPIRMFKGMRNVSCHFAELPCYDGHNKESVSTRSYLVIHLKQRGAVEVYRLQQGPKVAAVAVPQQKDCVVIECHGPPSQGGIVESFLLERMEGLVYDNRREDFHYMIDKLVIDDPGVLCATTGLPKQTQGRSAVPHQSENKMQLRLLMQLLAPDTNIQCNAQTVLTTFKSIKALSDLGEGLDTLSKCSRLEKEMGIDGCSLHLQAISFCKSRLNSAKEMEAQEGSGTIRKDAISDLELTIAYHDRLVNAYNVLHRYETRNKLVSSPSRSWGDQENDDDSVLSSWASEAMAWLLAANNDTLKNRFMTPSPDVNNEDEGKPLKFYNFAMACQSNGDRVYLTKVKRDRLSILKRCFRPLLQDLFVFKVVNSMFSNMGIDEDFTILQQWFGEWICSLSTHDIAKTNITSGATWRPMIRWLQDLILSAYDLSQQQKMEDDSLWKVGMLESLMNFCMEMEDLPKAFLLSVICIDAVSSASTQLEQKTYGKITQLECVRPWEDLLRKLRVCLLVTLRLGGDVNPIGGLNPMTVASVSRPDIFSVFCWIARDELTISHDNQTIVALEIACLSSPEAFYPSTNDGDSVEHKETIFQSCSSPRQLTLNNPSGLSNDTHSRSLLFYLKDYARFTTHLAANRALILASMWGKAPQNLNLLNHALSALHIVVDRIQAFSLATLVEVYQTQIRPVCRAMLFDFEEHELSEDVVGPLIEDQIWSQGFITAVKEIMSMIVKCMAKMSTVENTNNNYGSNDMWPPLRGCPILNILVTKLRDVQLSSVEVHHMVLFAFEMTGNVGSLESIIPSFSNLFLIGSIFSEMPPIPQGCEEQQELLNKAICARAEKSSSPVVDSFLCIHDIELFGKSLGLDAKYVRTQYLLEMIRLGKDASINDLLGSNISSLDKELFAQRTIIIICWRLNATIMSLKQTKNYRGVLSLLDAEKSRWVKEVATQSSSTQQNKYATTSLIATHSLIMRVQGMADTLNDALVSDKVNALYLMSGRLLKAVQAHEAQSVMSL